MPNPKGKRHFLKDAAVSRFSVSTPQYTLIHPRWVRSGYALPVYQDTLERADMRFRIPQQGL
jgi:hypothetical protein